MDELFPSQFSYYLFADEELSEQFSLKILTPHKKHGHLVSHVVDPATFLLDDMGKFESEVSALIN